jgi:ABC-type phosphate/phosphonate transport system substrate-binding protein
VLPVFFKRADAACLARGSWETAVELNPQLGRDLRALAVSPKIIPIAIGFRRGCNANGRKMLLDSMLTISNSTAGQQISALYQARGFVARPTSVMKGTVEMVRKFQRLSAQQAGSQNGKP